MKQCRAYVIATGVGLALASNAEAQSAPGQSLPPGTPPSASAPPVGTYPPMAQAPTASPPVQTPPYNPPQPVPSSVPAPTPAAAPPTTDAAAAQAPAYGAGPTPPPEYYYPPPAAPPPIAPPPAPAPSPFEGPERGLYVSAGFGVGAPFGGNTTVAGGFSEGAGLLGVAGYAIIPNFGLDAFVHYNFTSLTVRNDIGTLDDNSGHVLLYGAEARGMAGAGRFIGWLSVGFSLGTGSLSLRQSSTDFTTGVSANDDVTFGVMPVLGFGADIALIEGLSIGPQLRWYITNASRACSDQTVSFPAGFGGPTSNKRCTESFGNLTVPDILFVGAGLTYRIDFTK
jgi:hypothetical protein